MSSCAHCIILVNAAGANDKKSRPKGWLFLCAELCSIHDVAEKRPPVVPEAEAARRLLPCLARARPVALYDGNYRPRLPPDGDQSGGERSTEDARPAGRHPCLPRKEVIHPQIPLRIPCYDFVPVRGFTLAVHLPCGLALTSSGASSFHDMTGGVYKTQEHIHRRMADRRLLAIPTS